MSKVITVWGSPGSGKSMFCCILAKALTRDKQKAIIINADISVPMLPVWLPEQMIETGASIGHVSPEAAAGGLLAYVRDDDLISIDIPNHSINLLVPEDELARRQAETDPQPPKQVSGYLKRYRALVTSASRGAILDDSGL